MDTNSLLQLVQAMKQSGGSPEWFSPTLITAAVGALMALAALMQARTAAIKATLSEANTKESKVTAEKTAGEVEKIHVAVNSRDSAMQAELAKLREEILRVTGDNKTLEESKRARDLADAAKLRAVIVQPKSSTAADASVSDPAGNLSEGQLAQLIQTLQAEQTAREKK